MLVRLLLEGIVVDVLVDELLGDHGGGHRGSRQGKYRHQPQHQCQEEENPTLRRMGASSRSPSVGTTIHPALEVSASPELHHPRQATGPKRPYCPVTGSISRLRAVNWQTFPAMGHISRLGPAKWGTFPEAGNPGRLGPAKRHCSPESGQYGRLAEAKREAFPEAGNPGRLATPTEEGRPQALPSGPRPSMSTSPCSPGYLTWSYTWLHQSSVASGTAAGPPST